MNKKKSFLNKGGHFLFRTTHTRDMKRFVLQYLLKAIDVPLLYNFSTFQSRLAYRKAIHFQKQFSR